MRDLTLNRYIDVNVVNKRLHTDPTNTPESPLAAKKEARCVLCGVCLEVCPLFKATGREELSPRAKLFLLERLAENPESLSDRAASKLAGLCLCCGRCEEACPHGLSALKAVSRTRASHPDFSTRLWKTLMQKANVLMPAAAFTGAALSGLKVPGLPGKTPGVFLDKLKALGKKEIKPWLAVKDFDARGNGERAVVFPGCVASYARTEWTLKANALLAGLGFEVCESPNFACCGLTLDHAGLAKQTLALRKQNLEAWRSAGRPLVITFCASCQKGLLDLANDPGLEFAPGEREEWTAAIRPLSGLFGKTRFEVQKHAPKGVHYHRPCHAPGVDTDGDWLEKTVGKKLIKRSEKECCGLGGVLQLSAPELSKTVANACWDFFSPEQGTHLVTGCGGCVLQLAATNPKGVQVGHWLEIVDWSLLFHF
ncbi:MAG: (Fe-S)-binding protein [Thermodesulfobacteriota bacterium]|nr:(Fe-S)-binding protein [Thermodesulfobacteriota bacterium]